MEPVSVTVQGRVVDQDGLGLAGVFVTLIDAKRLTGHFDARGCGTFHPQQRVESDAAGRFSAVLTFQPTRVVVSGQLSWVELPSAMLPVTAGEPIVITARSIRHRTLSGQVVDAEGRPVAGVRVLADGPSSSVKSDEQGRFELETEDPPPARFRARRMGYRPAVVESVNELQRLVLDRRPMVTVNVREPSGEPVMRGVVVSLWQNGARLSFCTAGDVALTHEPVTGTCALDAERGTVELQLDYKAVATLTVNEAQLSVTVEAPLEPPAPQPPAPGLDGY